MRSLRPTSFRGSRLRAILSVALVLVAAGMGAAVFGRGRRSFLRPGRTLHASLDVARPGRTLAPRLSVDVEYRDCSVAVTDTTVMGARCEGSAGPPADDAWIELATEVERRAEAGPDADALQTNALLKLISSGDAAELHKSLAMLKSALAFTRDPAGVMVDLSAEHLVLAGVDGSPDDLLRALQWADSALVLRPNSPPALFNRALALETLTADSGAALAWRRYLAVDRASPYAGEARRHLRTLVRPSAVAVPDSGASDAELEAFAKADPQAAFDSTWVATLHDWGAAVLAGDTATAMARLRRAEVLGIALAHNGVDASLADEVAAIRSARGTRLLPLLARAHVNYAEALRAHTDTNYEQADALLRRIDLPDSTSLGLWTRVARAAVRIQLRDLDGAGRQIDGVEGVAPAGYPLVRARARWLTGTLTQLRDHPGDAAPDYQEAERLYGRAGTQINRGTMDWLVADAEHWAANGSSAYLPLHRAALLLRPFRHHWRHSVLMSYVDVAVQQHLYLAARDLAEEDVAFTSALGIRSYEAEALMKRATVLSYAGEEVRVGAEVARALAFGDSLQPRTERYVEAVGAYARGLALIGSNPDSAEVELLRSSHLFQHPIWQKRALAARARAALASGDTSRAYSDLDSVFTALAAERGKVGGSASREVGDEIRASVLRLVALLVEGGKSREALRVVERASAVLSAVPFDPDDIGVAHLVPRGRVIVRPVLLDDSLFVWTVAGDSVSLTRTKLSRDSLVAVRDLALDALARGWDAQANTQLKALYRMLVAPVERRLGARDGEVVFVADGDLEAIPFSALLDARGEPLFESHVVWRAPSVASGAGAILRRGDGPITFIAPRVDPVLNPGLTQLAGADSEAAGATELYRPRGVSLVDSAATPTAVRAALERGGVVHLSGHAVTDELRPERSYLVLAPEAGHPNGRMTAHEIEGLQLSGLRLVVLSACSTLRGDAGSSGFTGLSGALLGAGAHGVIGSLWEVRDELTRELMKQFHQEYRQSGDPARALRAAQRAVRRDTASPSAWAAFQYVGR